MVALKPGTIIAGRFEITATLGAGSMGEVYQAEDRKLGRDVALKLLSPSLAASPEYLRRFEREARAASGLNHPHICTIYDVGHATEVDDRPYLVMELLRGQTLFELLLAGPLPLNRVIALGVQIAEALDVAHSAGIVHRDIKPANIFVTSRGDAKLLDFGLAAFAATSDPLATDVPRSALLTDPGTAVGTVLYMSPEQALGDPVDRRTDIFSFGLVIYEMVSGRRAFEGRSTTAILDAILHSEPPGLDYSETSTVPREIRHLLMRMLEKDRSRRTGDVSQVSTFLRAVQSGSIAGREFAPATPTTPKSLSSSLSLGSDIFKNAPLFTPKGPPSSASVPGYASRFGEYVRLDTMAVVLALVVGGYALWTRYHGADTPALTLREPVLLADFTNTTGDAVFDGALKDALEVQLQQSPFMNVVPASQTRAVLQRMERPADERITLAAAHELCQRMGVKAVLFGSIAPLGTAYLIGVEAQACKTGDIIAREQAQAESKTGVLASMGQAAAKLRERLGESIGSIQRFNVPAQEATTPSLEALKAYSMGLETRNRTGDLQAIPLFEHALELDPNFALASARLASIYTNLHDLKQAQRYMERAFERSDSLSEPERLFVKANHHYIVTGRLDEVVGTYRLWIQTYPLDWVPHNNLSGVLLQLGQSDEAVQEAREAMRQAPNSVIPSQQLARTLLLLDRIDEGRRVLRDALSHGLDSSYNRALLFGLAFLDNDAAAMQEHLAAARSRPDSYVVVAEAARATFARGDLEGSRALYAQAVSGARAAHLDDFAGSLVAEQAWSHVLAGDASRGRLDLDAALAIGKGAQTAWPASLAAAFLKRAPQAIELAAVFERDRAPTADVVAALSVLKAAVPLANGDGAQSIELLASATPYERVVGPWVPYLRGLAYEAAGDRVHAAAQFHAVVDRRGNQPTSLLQTLGWLELARSLAATGEKTEEARQAYEAFLAAWRNAAPQQPLLVAAKRELSVLQSPAGGKP